MKFNKTQECVVSGKQVKKVCHGGKRHQLSNAVTQSSKMRIQELTTGLSNMEGIRFS